MNTPSAHPAVAVIVVNWNGWPLTLACLDSLRASRGVDWHLFVVDNASSDDSRRHLANLGEDVTTIFSVVNGGWTGGNNLGIEVALAAGYDRFLILNNDAMVERDTMLRLSEDVAGQSSPPILGPLQRSSDGSLDFVGAIYQRSDGVAVDLKVHLTDFVQLGVVYDTAYIRGAGMFVCREHFARIGLFDDDYYLYYDDTDWCFRARAAGYRVAMTQNAAIIHVGSASLGGGHPPLFIYFMVRNSLLFARRHARPGQRLHQLVWLSRWLAPHGGSGSRFRRLATILLGRNPSAVAARRAFIDFLTGRFGNCPPVIRTLSDLR